MAQSEWEKISDTILIEKYIIKRNTTHPQQASDTPCTIELLKSFPGEAGLTTSRDEELLSIVNINESTISNNQRIYLNNFRRNLVFYHRQ